ncbi:DNA-(apurinic or apyrimidinic site) endonuclease 2 isoform X2 [Rhipicephalus sanguineus]|uniref:DNA-(apurinic or apyrimidinic site) endonuclease 2 isoform X2 n=1 Tax=Rhipicephalus sanguineus TaxID=34632 RepID=UPI0020C452EF|nr:DNA-(apurinic or apyrimidinic site) endonuclease 2 isoform X2 [Rhipicephalus sanguineus]
MKLLSWNVNGLRSFKTSVKDVLRDLDADIICFQETKATRSVLEESWAIVDGYSSYFSFPRHQSGYSGVATYCKDSCRPFAAEEGLTDVWSSAQRGDCVGSYGDTLAFDSKFLSAVDGEGRAVLTLHHAVFGEDTKRVAVINVYCPRADPERPERGQMKLDFYNLLELRAKALLESGVEVIILGDLNTSHCKIDHCDPSEDEDFYANPGRQWLSKFLLSGDGPDAAEATKGEPEKPCFHDTFRALHPTAEKAFTCWNTRLGARQTNYGTRIDYILCSSGLLPFVSSSEILPEVFGSDHCPVKASIACTPVASPQCPSYSTRHWPEFSGRQQSIAGFLSKGRCTSAEKATRPPEALVKKCAEGGGQPAKKLKFSKNGQSTLKGFFAVENKGKVKVKEPDSNAGVTSLTNGSERELSDKTFSSTDATVCQLAPGDKFQLEIPVVERDSVKQANHSSAWKNILKGPPAAPLCKGHGERCVLRTVKKPGPNLGRQFFVCPRPEGHSSDPNARCNFFQWVNPPKKTKAAAEVLS